MRLTPGMFSTFFRDVASRSDGRMSMQRIGGNREQLRDDVSDPNAPKNGRLLDLGCGVGNFLAAARDSGFEVTGVEFNQSANRFARETYGLREIFAMRPEDFRSANPAKTFDVVTFFEVLEHQDDP